MKKIIALLVCVVLICGFAVPAFAVAEVAFQLTPNGRTSLRRGDTITVAVGISASDVVDQFGILFEYDEAVFELVGGKNTTGERYTEDADGKNITAISSFSREERGLFTSFYIDTAPNGVIGYITLKVKDNAPYGTATLTGTTSARLDGVAQNMRVNTVTFKISEGSRLVLTEELANEHAVYVEGLPCAVKKDGDSAYIDLPDAEDRYLVTYTYHEGDGEDVHTQYPTGMKVYKVVGGQIVHIPELDDLLQYSGSSIRITGNKGIRMITSLEKTKKAALTGAGLGGFTLEEYGTVLSFAGEIGEGDGLVLGRSFARSNYAYKKGEADPVFAATKDLVQYTNVLVGFSLDQCKDDIAMRPYIVLKDGEGALITLYGGTIYRSIGYIAYQNRNVFTPKTASYNYVWEIIHHVFGTQYDADFKG